MKIKYLLFDADDTLLDFKAAEKAAFERAAIDFGVEPTAENLALYSEINDRLWKQIETGEVTNAELQRLRFARLLDRLGVEGDGLAMNDAYVGYLSQAAHALPGAIDAAARCLVGRVGALVTNGLPNVQRPRCEASGLVDLFGERIYISGEVGHQKPSREYFDHVCAALGIDDRSEALVIGDSLSSDILGGNNAGIPTCWVSHGKKLGSSKAKPDYTIGDVTELEAVLEKLENS